MAQAEVIELETETQKAVRYKSEMIVVLEPLLQLMDRAKRDGLLIEFQLGVDHYGRAHVCSSAIVKRF